MAAVEAWPQWTPTMTSVRYLSGTGVGAVYEVRQPGLPKTQLTISEWIEGKSFTWTANEKPSSTVATHVLEPLDESQTEVILSISMSGPFASLIWFLWGRKIRNFVDTESMSLKNAVEAANSN